MSEAALVLALVAASLTQTAADAARPGVFRITPLRPVAELRAEALAQAPPAEPGPFRPVDLVELTALDASLRLDVRYATSDNFLGVPVYPEARAFLQRPAAEALVRAHRALAARGFGLLIHDGYRPWWVTKVFWEATPPSGHDFVADPAKGSRHNRGCAVDLTLYRLADGEAVEMPSLYDEMSERSAPGYAGGSAEARRLRDVLRAAMKREGFSVNPSEWWHFDYRGWREYPILNIPFDRIGRRSGAGGRALLSSPAMTTAARIPDAALAALLLTLAVAIPRLHAEDAQAKARLDALLQDAWENEKRENPPFATSTGDHRYDDRLQSVATVDLERRAAAARGYLERLRAIDAMALAPQDRVSHAMLERDLRDDLARHQFRTDRVPITADSGFHTGLSRLPQDMPLATVKDYENYIARLRAIPAFFDQHIEHMREGLKSGFTVARVALAGYDATMRPHAVSDPEASVFWKPFVSLPPGVPASEAERLRAAGREAIAKSVAPAYQRLLDFFTKEYEPGARATLGASEMPDGKAYYAWCVKHFTTLDTTPEAVHQVGLGEVDRIRREMDGVVQQVGFKGSFPEFLEFLRTDPRFYAKTPDELMKQASWIAKRMDARLPSLFGRLPRQPYGVEPVPDDLAPKYTGGRYVGAPLDGRRAGTYWVNTYALETRPFYQLESLTLHEAVPGHHLQGALAKELTGIPEFRRYGYVNAFGEGWGLYSERLGLEAGFYQDPYNNFGRLSYEMWRACRLVVDTGIHAMGWTRQRAIDYMKERTALSSHEVTTEVDRYISWPGQALAYKMGELKIRELRARAEKELGTRFDVRAFHDAVLASGSVPLDVLERQIDEYIAATKGAGAPSAP